MEIDMAGRKPSPLTNLMSLTTMRECDACGSPETRVFTDSWTGKSLCMTCVCEVAPQVTMSPEDGDNLAEKLVAADRLDEDDARGWA